MMRAVIYSRVSTPKQATKGYGLGRQREVCEEFADEHGYTVLEAVEDVIPGDVYDRPGLWRVRRLVQARVVDVVLIEAWDRLRLQVSDVRDPIRRSCRSLRGSRAHQAARSPPPRTGHCG